MTRGSKSQYGCRLSLKPHENEENRRSTGRPYEKIPQKELTLIIVEEEEFSTLWTILSLKKLPWTCHNSHSNSPPARCLV